MLSSTRHTLLNLAELEQGWGGSGEQPPSSQAINIVQRLSDDAVRLVGNIHGVEAEPWAIAPLDNGGLLAEWRGFGGDLELHISPDGEVGYLLITGTDGARCYEEGEAITLSDASQLIAQILLGQSHQGK